MNQDLLNNIDEIHTTEMRYERIKKNLKCSKEDVVTLCKEDLKNPKISLYRAGKNWYASIGSRRWTIHAKSYTIITAHLIN